MGVVGLIEASYSGGFGGHRFWLFLFNIFSSAVLIFWLSAIMAVRLSNPFVFLFGVFVSVGFMVFFEVDESWARLTHWRRGR